MKNKFEIRGDVTAIIINSPKYGKIEALISTNKLERVKEFPNSWYANYCHFTQSFYIVGKMFNESRKRERIILHRWITKAPMGLLVDHINHDTVNNTDKNLRIATHVENQQNRQGPQRNSKSRVRGVIWNKSKRKWFAKIKIQGKQIDVGFFDDIEEADIAVIEARKKYMPFSKEASA